MRNRIFVIVASLALVAGCLDPGDSNSQNVSSWQEEFGISDCSMVPSGRNTYFILEPGFQLVLESANEKLMITVLDETREVDGILTRVVEEREWRDDNLIEVSRNFFAMCEATKDIFYFGEEVDMYSGGKVDSHQGAWLAGKKNAKAGLIMPGEPQLGMKYYQELAPGAAMDRAEVIKLDNTFETPAGIFSNCLITKEGSALSIFEVEYKTYAPGIGLIQDEKLLLSKHGFIDKE